MRWRPSGARISTRHTSARLRSADGRQPALGARPDARRPDTRARSRDPRGRGRPLPPHGARTRPVLVAAGLARPHALQHGRPGDRRLREALGAIRAAGSEGLVEHVWVDETRPLLQGSRLTAWELESLGIPFAVIADSAAAFAHGCRRGRLRRSPAPTASRRTATPRTRSGRIALARRRAPSRRAVLRRRSDHDGRCRDGDGRRHPDRGPRPDRGQRALPGANPAFDVTPAELDRRDRDRGGHSSSAVRGITPDGGSRMKPSSSRPATRPGSTRSRSTGRRRCSRSAAGRCSTALLERLDADGRRRDASSSRTRSSRRTSRSGRRTSAT